MSLTALCAKQRRFGGAGDSGWTLCVDRRAMHVRDRCVIFSFGVGFDAAFDLDAATRLPWCEVHMFDPTPQVVEVLSGSAAAWAALYGKAATRTKDTLEAFRAQTRGLLANGTATTSPGALSLPNVRFHPFGLAARDRNGTLRNWWTQHRMSRTIKRAPTAEFLSLDSIVARVGRTPSVVKVDIEGAEKQPGVLEALLHSGAPQLALELHKAGKHTLKQTQLLASAAAAGYRPWRSERAEYKDVNSIHYLLSVPVRLPPAAAAIASTHAPERR